MRNQIFWCFWVLPFMDSLFLIQQIKRYYVCVFTFAICSCCFILVDIWQISCHLFEMYISFLSSNGTEFFEKDNCLVHMQVWCSLATCSEAKICPTSAFQLILVSIIKKWFGLLVLCNFSSRWNNSTLRKLRRLFKRA